MYDRETILKAIDICTIGPECSGCPLKDVTDCDGIIKRGVLNLLRPHVLTLEEATTKNGELVWIELRDSRYYERVFVARYEEHDVKRCCYQYWTMGEEVTSDLYYRNPYVSPIPLAIYGRDWRCWTQKPSEAQMEATPWET